MASGNSRKLLKALSDMLLVPETKAELVRRVGTRLRLLVGENKCLFVDLRQAGAGGGAAAASGNSPVLRDDTKAEVDAVLHLSDADFALVCAGELDPSRAFMTGRLRVRGNLIQAMKCGPIFELMRPHTRPLPAAVGPTMCVPKEVAAAILVVGAGFLLTQGVAPAKAEGILSTGGSSTIGIMREASGTTQLAGDLELAQYLQAKTTPASSDCLALAILDL
eukprot:g7604.t1